MGKATLHEGPSGRIDQSVVDHQSGETLAESTVPITMRPYPVEAAGRVNVVLGTTLNIGDYSSWKVSVTITVPFEENTPEDQQGAFLAAYDFARRKVEEITQAGIARVGNGVQLPKYG